MCNQETEAQLEHLFEIDLQLNMLRPDENDAFDVIKGIQVASPALLLSLHVKYG